MTVEMGTWLVHPWCLFCILSAHAYPDTHTHTHTYSLTRTLAHFTDARTWLWHKMASSVINYVYATLQENQENANAKPKTEKPTSKCQSSQMHQPFGNGNGIGNGHVNDNGHVNWFGPSGRNPSRWYTRQISPGVRPFIVILIPLPNAHLASRGVDSI